MLVPALVKDAQDHLIYGLTANDFAVEDDGVPQTVYLDDSAESDPVSMVVAIQTGRRAKREFSRIRGISTMPRPVIEQPSARMAIVEFDKNVHLVRNFTKDVPALDELQQLHPGDNGAAILDALKLSASLLAKEAEGRTKILLLVSEMRDHGSHFARIDDVVASIGNSNTVVYVLAFSPSLSQVLDTERGANRDEAHWNAPADLLAPLLMARHDGVRDYWTRQWAMIDPHVDPLGFTEGPEGELIAEVHAVVRDLSRRVQRAKRNVVRS